MRNTKLPALILCFILFLTACGTSSKKSTVVIHTATSPTPTVSVALPTISPKKSGIEWVETPDSSCFTRIGYDESQELLTVTFRESGMTYEYENFPESEWKDFLSADSKGTWFSSDIKPYYDYSKKY